jgi:drug/metabolite transporter (DMT)-like permease
MAAGRYAGAPKRTGQLPNRRTPPDPTPQASSAGEIVSARRLRFVAIAMMCAAMICFAGLDTSAKWLGRRLPTVEVVWARYVVASVFTLFVTRSFWRPRVLLARRPRLQVIRSTLLFGSTMANFLALRQLQLAETSTISFLQPMFVALLAGPLLGERVGGARSVAIAVGFLGVLVATRPGTNAFQPIVVVAIGGVACAAVYALATRRLAAYDSPETTLAWTQVAGIALLTPVLPRVWETPPSAFAWAVMAAMGGFAALGHGLLILAHQRAPAPVLTPFNYTQLIWMIVSGMLVFGDRPPGATLLGAGLVVACGLFLVMYERRGRGEARRPE